MKDLKSVPQKKVLRYKKAGNETKIHIVDGFGTMVNNINASIS